MKEAYCSYEVAKLLKEKGFDEECIGAYSETNHTITKFEPNVKNSEVGPLMYSAPTHQMAMAWLREVHHYIIEIHYGNVGSPREPKMHWWWELENKQGEFLDGNITDKNTTYEEAVEAALKYCLENLI